jgi:VWFA-related protein
MTVLPAFAAKKVSVDQLNQALTALGGKTDAETAQHLADLELTERPSEGDLLRWQTELSGAQSRQALGLLTNAAAFLDLPPSEIPQTPAPAHEAQRHIMGLTVDYVSKAIHQLPNLFATRRTIHYEDEPQGYAKGGMVFVPAKLLHFTGTTSTTVVYRDGAEIQDAKAGKLASNQAAVRGLTTSGEFGPILVTILIDAAHGTLSWSHWESGSSGPLAVFRYGVPAEKSHYEVSYCCFPNPEDLTAALQPFHQVSGYHGEMAVDPATGSILRLTLQADLKQTDPLVRADIMVEYGRVEIGDKSYICPLRSVSISVGHVLQASDMQHLRISTDADHMQYAPGHMQTLLNEVSFEQYHLFHADARLLASNSGPPEQHPTAPAPSSPTSPDISESTAAAVPPPAENTSTTTYTDVSTTPAPSSNSAPLSAPAEAPANATPVEPSFDVPGFSARNQEKVPTFKANSRAVVVDVVVTRRNDEPVRGLQKENFQVLEDGKSQSIDYFEEHVAATELAATLPAMPPNVFTNQPAVPPGDSVNVLLLDSLNTDREDQAFIQQQILSYLKTIEPGTRIAIFALSSKLRMIQGFSTDSSALKAALNDPKYGASTTRTAMSSSLQDKVGDQDEVANLAAIQMSGTVLEALQASQAKFAGYQTDQRVTMTLEAMNYIARYLAGISGRKNLIWFSGSFPISVFPSGKERQPSDTTRQYSPKVRETADLLTLSNVAVYPVGAQGVVVEHPTEATNAMPTNTEGPSEDNRMGGSTSQRQGDPMAPYFGEHNARSANMAAMEQLAADTGGEAIFNTNDLNKAVARVVQNGSHYYTLVYTPTNKSADGKYRRIEVAVNGSNYKLAYRRGYYADQGAQPEDAAPTANPLRPLLVHGLPGASQLLYGVRILPVTQQPAPDARRAGGNDKLTGPLTRYNVDFMIRWTDVDLQTTPRGTHSGQIEAGVIAYGRDGKPVNWINVTQKMNLEPATFTAIQSSGIPAHIEIDLPQQDLYLMTGIYDWASKRAGTLEVPLNALHAQASASQQPGTAKPN